MSETIITNLEHSSEYKALQQLDDSMNVIGWSPVRFAQSVRSMHRTTQQTLFRTVIAIIKYVGSEEYGTDQRNIASHKLAKKIIESGVLGEAYLPYI